MKPNLFAVLLFLQISIATAAPITVRDDAGNTVILAQPAQRIISLAPHITELLFAAGGGDRIVGTVDYSDYPAAASKIVRVGNHQQIDIERIIALKPDLIIAWLHGSSERQLQQLHKLGIPFFYNGPKKLQDIPDSVRSFGKLLGTDVFAEKNATAERAELVRLNAQYTKRPPVRIFYQVWDKPLYTLNGEHIMSDVFRLCGGVNIFSALHVTAPAVSVEAVLLENPEVMFVGSGERNQTDAWSMWTKYPNLRAVKNGNLFSIDSDLLSRAGPRLIQGAALVCEKLEQARSRRTPQP